MTTSNTPKVGDGATVQLWSDRHAYTIIQVLHNGRRIVLQRDIATRTDSNGMSEIQQYTYQPDPNGSYVTATLRRDGTFRELGSKTLVHIGSRNEYYDYSF